MRKRVLGLDIGVASIGWSVVDLEEEKFSASKEKEAKYKITDGKIVASGVRIFQQPIDRQKKSLALIRGEARRTRATIERKAERLQYLIKLAQKNKIIDNTFSVNMFKASKGTSPETWDIWKWRTKALDEKLSNFELFRILYHIANHRGFYFQTRAEKNDIPSDNEKKVVKNGLKTFGLKFEESGLRTVGEYIYKKCNQKRNKAKSYELAIKREDLQKEVEAIFESQIKLGNQLINKKFEEEYINNVLMYNHPIDEKKLQKMMSTCELVDGAICAPKEAYSAEIFSLYNRLNNLVLKQGKTDINLTDSQRLSIFAYAHDKKEVTFSDLRKILNIDEDIRFNLCSYQETNPEFSKSISIKKDEVATLSASSFELYDESGEIHSFVTEIQNKSNEYFEKLDKAKTVKYYYSDIRRMLKLSDSLRFVALKNQYNLSKQEIGIKKYLEQFEKEVFISLKGYHKIKKALGNNFESVKNPELLNVIAEALVYYKTDESRIKYLQEHAITDTNIINQILELSMSELSNFSKEALEKLNIWLAQGMSFAEAKIAAGFKEKECQKGEKLQEYKGFYEKNPTVARILGQFRKLVNAINAQYGAEYPIDEIHVELATDVANSKQKKMMIAMGQKQYKEQKDAARSRCQELGINPDSGDNLLRFKLAEEQDWKCIYTGRGICPSQKEKTPSNMESIFECEIDHIIPRSRSFNDSLNNKVLCLSSANQEKKNQLPYEWLNAESWKNFSVRVKNCNKISSAKKQNLLKETFDEEDLKKFISRDLNNTRYATRHIAEYLRKYFDFSKSHNPNIEDANRIRVMGGGITSKLRHMWGLEKSREESHKHHAMDAIVLACASFGHVYYICSVLKKLEEEGKRPGKQSLAPWQNIREDINNSLGNIFVSKMARCSATGSAHKEPAKKKKGYKLIQRQNSENVIDVQLDSMFRYDIYKNDTRYYCVPIYAIDLHSKDHKHFMQPYEYDDHSNKKEAAENEYVFSLYKDSYIEVYTSDGETTAGYLSQYNAQSGQFYIDSRDGDKCFEISTKTFQIGDTIKYKVENEEKIAQISEFDKEKSELVLVVSANKLYSIKATVKTDKKGEDTPKFVTDIPYVKLDKVKKVSISTFTKLRKFSIDFLGNKVEVKREKERFSNKMKSNAVRYREKLAKKQLRQGGKNVMANYSDNQTVPFVS